MGYLSPTLAVRNVKKAVDFYTGTLGFELGMTFPTPDNPEYADLQKDDMVIMLISAKELGIKDDEKLGTGVNLYMQIDGDIDDYCDELKLKGASIISDIKDEPFGIRDFTIEDIDGYKLTFNQLIDEGHDECGCGSCDSCMSICESCGMPMSRPEDHGGGNIENTCCVHCCQSDGSLKSYEDVLQGMTAFIIQSHKMDKTAAEKAAREHMAGMPAWQNRA